MNRKASQINTVLADTCKELGVDLCYLFGSRADGTAYQDSDIDVGAAFMDYNPEKHDLSMEIVTQQAFEEKLRPFSVDLVFIQRMPVNLKFNIINGIVMYSRNENFRTDLEENIVRDYLDFKPVLEAYYREMAESILSGE